ncbi:hypothetical protein NE237_006536 [Protea cynaroides]|uniref:Uncharacterized protein n=1 Tax=Protea cynaroides TaxID=273540 RepID=A0A9Q0QVJ0_9MAGN|nr:hypothetical protein NE237_006536 [Protea cynaroides]
MICFHSHLQLSLRFLLLILILNQRDPFSMIGARPYTLMGVSFPAITARISSTARVSSQRENNVGSAIVGDGGGESKRVERTRMRMRTRRKWWKLCRDDSASSSSLGDFLEVERRFGDGTFYGEAAELENVVPPSSAPGNGRLLFADGRVLPPSQTVAPPPPAGALCRLPVLLTGICTGGGG